MGVFDGILLLSDMDGTLLHHSVLEEEHLKAVRYFVSEGGIFCPATGRQRLFLEKNFPDILASGYCIEKNGTMVYDFHKGGPIWKKALTGDPYTRAEQLLRNFPNVQTVNVHLADGQVGYSGEQVLDGTLRQNHQNQEVFKLVFGLRDNHSADLAEYYKDFDDFEYICSCDHLFEIYNKGAGKGVCAKILREYLRDKIFLTVGIGDYDNDIPLLKAVDFAVAVESDCERVREYADVIAPPIEEYPIRWLVQYLENRVREGSL